MKTQRAIFAGGCFWCTQPVYDQIDGVKETVVGYIGGDEKTAEYDAVCSGTTDHAEALAVDFDPDQVSYTDLLDIFWRNIDPTTLNQQFFDKGTQYRTAVFCTTVEQLEVAEKSRQDLEESGVFALPVVTEVLMAPTFYNAEKYHQKYYQKEPERYEAYKRASGRQEFIQCTWNPNKKLKRVITKK